MFLSNIFTNSVHFSRSGVYSSLSFFDIISSKFCDLKTIGILYTESTSTPVSTFSLVTLHKFPIFSFISSERYSLHLHIIASGHIPLSLRSLTLC